MTQLSSTTSTCEPQWKMRLLRVLVLIYLTAVCAAQEDVTDVTTLPDTTVYDPPEPTLQRTSAFSDVFTTEKVTLSCRVSGSSGWTFSWEKDGQPLSQNADFSFLGDGSVLTIIANSKAIAGSYTCTGNANGRKTRTSKPTVVKVNEPPVPTLKLVTRWSDVFETEMLNISCGVVGNEWTLTWYKDQNELRTEGPSFVFPSVTKDDKGEYTCKAQLKSRGVVSKPSNPVVITVYANKPKPTLSRSPHFNMMYPGEVIVFTCSVDVPSEWKYEWYKDGNKIEGSSNNNYKISSVTGTNKGEYQCKVKRGEGPMYTSDNVSLQVSEPPVPTLKLVTRWSDVFETEMLNISCGVVGNEWTLTWYKDQKELRTEGPSLVFPSVTKDDKGEYTCKAQLKSRGVVSKPSNPVVITVYEKKPTPVLNRSPGFPTMYPGESVTFTCTIDKSSGWEYEWFHNGNQMNSHSSNTSTIRPVTRASSGQYLCLAKRGPLKTDQSEAVPLQVSDPPTPILKLLSPWQDVFENENLKLSCEVDDPKWTFTWHRDQTELQKSPGLILDDNGSELNITAVKSSDKGQYTCKAHLKNRGVSSVPSNTSDVSVYNTVPTPTISRDPKFDPMYIGETVKFKCTVFVSSGWSYLWYQNGTKLNKSGKEINITLNHSDNGGYSCSASRGEKTSTRRSEEIQLHIREIPVPLLKQKTPWLDVFPSEGAELSCKMEENSGWIFTWYKNSEVVSENIVPISGKESSLSITNAAPSHRGNYTCSGQLKDRSVRSKHTSKVTLHIYEEKPTVTLLQEPQDSVMHTSDFISFTCHINVSSGWKYQWYRDRSKLDTSGHIHNISSALTSESGSYQCQVTRGKTVFKSEKSLPVNLKIEERPLASIILLTGWSEVFSTDSLLLKCEVTDNLNMNNTWNYTWFKEGKTIGQSTSQTYKVTPQDDPEQSLYTCQGFRNERPYFSKGSDSYRTKNLLLKRRILLSISGCLFFGIIAVFLGCIALRVFRKPDAVEERPEEANLFLTMAQLKDRNDAPCPLVEYITDADLNQPSKEGEENGTSCSETTPLPVTSPEEQAVTTNGKEATENGGKMVSFQH